MNRAINYLAVAVTGAFMWSCAPQARFFNVDVKHNAEKEIGLEDSKAAVFPVFPSGMPDSLLICNAGIGLAEKLEKDRGLLSGEIPVYCVPQAEFKGLGDDHFTSDPDREYMHGILDQTGADILIFVDNLSFENFVNRSYGLAGEDYAIGYALLPFTIDMHIYDTGTDRLLYSKFETDTVYLQMPESSGQDLSYYKGMTVKYLPEVSKKIGEKLASYLTPQWETQERMLITYEGERNWNEAYDLAQEFKWKEAIDSWMPLTRSENPKKAAFAAYNIAVGCEMLEQFDLAEKWIQFSLKKFRFREAYELKNHLDQLGKTDRP